MKNVFSFPLLLFLLVLCAQTVAQDTYIQPNSGQWGGAFDYKIEMDAGATFMHKGGMRFLLTDYYNLVHKSKHNKETPDEFQVSRVFMDFVDANQDVKTSGFDQAKHYNNYFYGKNPEKWHSKVYPFKRSKYYNIYDGIDIEYKTMSEGLKYNYILKPSANIDQIQTHWKGVDRVKVNGNQASVETEIGVFELSIPESYVYVNGRKQKIDIEYRERRRNRLGFEIQSELPAHYDSLVIDPVLSFATYSGSIADNWGTSACPDEDENAYGGGITFAAGYPTTPGSYTENFQGGTGTLGISSFDVSVSKFSDDGSNLLYATYIGGTDGNEIACSMITAPDGTLYILGVTSSDDFPIASNAYQSQFKGGSNTTQNGLGFAGSDIFVFRMSSDGASMLSSTYIGGSELDGLNLGFSLVKNYGDQFRGEIFFDENNNPVIVSSTESSDFPTVNAFNSTLGGSQDGIKSVFSPNLSSLLNSTYVGGSGDDALYSVRVNNFGETYFTGGTTSSDLNATSAGLNASLIGNVDGFIGKSSNGNLDIITYLGTTSYDQSYFVDLDLDEYVYVFGQTDGNYPITSGKYNNSGGGQFIHKLEADLESSIWSTRIGGTNGAPQISPTAFLVSDCYEIYIAGWGGATNIFSSSTTDGFPVTGGAYQSTTNGNNFYIGLYEPDMVGLDYATFIGGITSSANHVDGGTSRFDERGIVYHAVCASCGSPNNGFSSTPGAYSTTSQSSNCNMSVFKFDLSDLDASITTSSNDLCFPNGVQFTNSGTPGLVYEWNFDDGDASTLENPFHLFPGPGVYDVFLRVYDTTSCSVPDTTWTQITISDPSPNIKISPDTTVCPGTEVTFSVDSLYNGTYEWSSSSSTLSSSTAETPTSIINASTTVEVEITYACGTATASIEVDVHDYSFNTGPDSALCIGESTQLYTNIGSSWSWSPTSSLNDPTLQNPIATPQEDTEYSVIITTPDGCNLYDTTLVEVDQDIPLIALPDTLKLCSGSKSTLEASDARDYLWSPNYNISSLVDRNVTVSPADDTTYFVDLENACGYNRDSSFVDVIFPSISASDDTIICPTTSAHFYASGAEDYTWTPAESLVGENSEHVIAAPQIDTKYFVEGVDQYGCVAYDSVNLALFRKPDLVVSPDYYGFVGDTVFLEAEGSPGTYEWSPSNGLSCATCPRPRATPKSTQTYTVTLTDTNTCKVSDQVTVYFDGVVYVPNAFTPNDDRHNMGFGPKGGNIQKIEFLIFNRWGELVFESHRLDGRWYGNYDGRPAPMDVYVWKLKYTDINGKRHEKYGHVTLIR